MQLAAATPTQNAPRTAAAKAASAPATEAKPAAAPKNEAKAATTGAAWNNGWGGSRARDYLYNARRDAERALDVLRNYDDREPFDTSRNTDIRNDAKNTIDPRALDALDGAMYELGYPRDRWGGGGGGWGDSNYAAARDARDAYEMLVDSTWDLTTYDKHGGRDRPDVYRARQGIERAIDYIENADRNIRW